MRRKKTKAVIGVIKMNVGGKRGRGTPKRRWLDKIENDTRAVDCWCVRRKCRKSGQVEA